MRTSGLRKPTELFESDAAPENQSDSFARELTELSHKYGIGISGSPSLFVLEGIKDSTLAYKTDADGQLQLIST